MTVVVRKFTDERREKLLKQAARSLFFFNRVILRMPDLTDMHLELCANLQGLGEWGDWRRGVVVGFRGSLKSSICTIGYPTWAGLHPEALGLKDHATRILGSSYDNVVANFTYPILQTFTDSPRSGFLLWLYEHRLVDGFAGSTESSIRFKKWDARAQDAITGKGIEAPHEGYHGNLILFEDPEGADAERSTVENRDARRAINSATPLMIDPGRDRMLVVLTPHGPDPTAFRLIREDLGDKPPERSRPINWDNSTRRWKIFYKPVLDSKGDPTWPERFDLDKAMGIKRDLDRRTWNQQYMLLEGESGEGLFREKDIEAGYFEFLPHRQGIRYPVRTQEKTPWFQKRDWLERVETRTVRFDELVYYMHSDLIHREDTVTTKFTGNARPSRAAIVVVGVAPDGHAFVMEYWNWPHPDEKEKGDENLGAIEIQVREAFRMHQRYGFRKATWDSVGAQVWFKSFLENEERNNPLWRNVKSSGLFGPARLLPRLSAMLHEDKRTVRMHKEDIMYERLAPWVEKGTLHLHPKQQALTQQLLTSFGSTTYIDLADALAQGPPVWMPGPSRAFRQEAKSQRLLDDHRRDPDTGHYSPYRRSPPKKKLPESPDGDAVWLGKKLTFKN